MKNQFAHANIYSYAPEKRINIKGIVAKLFSVSALAFLQKIRLSEIELWKRWPDLLILYLGPCCYFFSSHKLQYDRKHSSASLLFMHLTTRNYLYNVSVTCLLSCLDEELLLLRDRDEIFCEMAELRSSELILRQTSQTGLQLVYEGHSSTCGRKVEEGVMWRESVEKHDLNRQVR